MDRPIGVMKEVTQDITAKISNKVSSLIGSLTKKDLDSSPLEVANYQPQDALQADYVRMGSDSLLTSGQGHSTPMQNPDAGLGAALDSGSVGAEPAVAGANGASASSANMADGVGAARLPGKGIVVCSGCRRQLSHPLGASAIQCVMCKTIMRVAGAPAPPPPLRTAPIRCCRCPAVLSWPSGATQVPLASSPSSCPLPIHES